MGRNYAVKHKRTPRHKHTYTPQHGQAPRTGNTTRNGAASIDLGHHSLLTADAVVLIHVILNGVGHSRALGSGVGKVRLASLALVL